MVRMNRPAPVEVCYKNMRFLITHNPTNATMGSFIEDLKKYGATTVVRVCEVTYDKTPLEKDGITVMQQRSLPVFTISQCLKRGNHVDSEEFKPPLSGLVGFGSATTSLNRRLQMSTPQEQELYASRDWPFDDGAPPPTKIVDDWLSLLKSRFCEDPGCCVAVHCVAGLGRAPVLVALALIESGMKYEDAIQFIRQKRRGAINSKQLTYLEKYRPKQRLRFKDPHNHKSKCCLM
ncbi:hypothetical protein DNTS_029783 [Danionella cerebrum]|uniref:Uncharacterized protein n=1 Tax=Danionella cerebrum TaxID=2873325 RepID=A0A553QJB9_9TELE|nr:hypothetical protein DNTS_029783 [Danionella translucida]